MLVNYFRRGRHRMTRYSQITVADLEAHFLPRRTLFAFGLRTIPADEWVAVR